MTINYKVFAAGDTLSANDLLTYIENQAVIQVDNEAELTTLNTTYPSVRVAFAQDTDKMYVNNDGVWEAVVSGTSPSLTNLTLTGNLTVQGSTTTIDSTTIAVKDKFIFEGATADAHETTLQVAEPTADRTITLPDATGTVALTSGLYALPSQTGNSGKYLKTDGTNETWSIDATSDLVTTAGDIVYGTAADTMARLGIGTANQVLRVNSGATAPEWATPAGGALAMAQIATGNVNSGTSVTISSLSSYDNLIIMFRLITVSIDSPIYTVKINNTASTYYVSGGTNETNSTNNLKTNNGGSIQLTGNIGCDGANSANLFMLQLTNCKSTGFTNFQFSGAFAGTSGSANSFGTGIFATAAAVSSLVFEGDGGQTFNGSGTYTIWGA